MATFQPGDRVRIRASWLNRVYRINPNSRHKRHAREQIGIIQLVEDDGFCRVLWDRSERYSVWPCDNLIITRKQSRSGYNRRKS